MANPKLKLLKILDILQDTDTDNPVTAPQIVEKLRAYGIESERKSVCRDIQLLMDSGVDIEKCHDRKLGWYMASRKFEDWELKILIDAVNASQFLTAKHSVELAEKLKSLSSELGRKTLTLATPIPSQIKTGNIAVRRQIDTILTAIKTKQKIEFQYTEIDETLQEKLRGEGRVYVVSPYSLIWRNERYYVICNYEKYDNLSYYRLDRMQNLSTRGLAIRAATEILGANPSEKIAEFVSTSIYSYSGERIRLKLKVKKSALSLIVDYFGDGVSILSKNQDEFVTVSMYVQDGDGILRWLLQYGHAVEVIEPERLRQEVIKALRECLEKYEKGEE